MTIYGLDYVFSVGQQISDSGRFSAMGLWSIVSDIEKVDDGLHKCKHKINGENKCAQEVLDEFTKIYQTYVKEQRGPYTTPMVGIEGELKEIELNDEVNDEITGKRMVGNFLPLTPSIYLATDWSKGIVTQFTANFHDFDRTSSQLWRRGGTVRMKSREKIGGITRDSNSLYVVVGTNGTVLQYPISPFVFAGVNKDSGRMVGLNVKVNEIEYDPLSGNIWGVQENSDRIIEFNTRGYIGEIKFNDALHKFVSDMSSGVSKCKLKPDADQMMELKETTVTAVAGISFIANNWLLVSPWNSSTRFIVEIKRSSSFNLNRQHILKDLLTR